MGGIPLVELLKDVLSHLGRDAAACVPHPNHRQVLLGLQGQGEGAARLGELHRVGKQVVPHQREQLAVRLHQHVFLDVRLDVQALFLPGVFKGEQTLAQLLPQIVGFRLGENLLVLQLVQL